jgi:hypothetical protein
MILVRNVEQEGWQTGYQALAPNGQRMPVTDYLALHPEVETVDADARLRCLAGPLSGDLLLVSNYKDGFYFGGPTLGVHGGLHPQDSLAVASLGWPGATHEQRRFLCETVQGLVYDRRSAEKRSRASLADVSPALVQLMGWKDQGAGE